MRLPVLQELQGSLTLIFGDVLMQMTRVSTCMEQARNGMEWNKNNRR